MSDDFEDSTPWHHSMQSRVATLETASDQHTVGISDQRGHLASMDEDLTQIQVEFRAQRGMLQALHNTQTEHITVLREHSAVLHEHSAVLHEHSAVLGQHSMQLAEIQLGIRTIVDMLTPLTGSQKSDGGAPD